MAVDDLFEQVARQQAARTARLIGATDEDRLRWLLKFAATENFDEMSSLKFERLRRQIQEFASIRWSSYETADNPVSRDAARQLALKVGDGLGDYARGRSWDLPQMSIARSVHQFLYFLENLSKSVRRGGQFELPRLPCLQAIFKDSGKSAHPAIRG